MKILSKYDILRYLKKILSSIPNVQCSRKLKNFGQMFIRTVLKIKQLLKLNSSFIEQLIEK